MLQETPPWLQTPDACQSKGWLILMKCRHWTKFELTSHIKATFVKQAKGSNNWPNQNKFKPLFSQKANKFVADLRIHLTKEQATKIGTTGCQAEGL